MKKLRLKNLLIYINGLVISQILFVYPKNILAKEKDINKNKLIDFNINYDGLQSRQIGGEISFLKGIYI